MQTNQKYSGCPTWIWSTWSPTIKPTIATSARWPHLHVPYVFAFQKHNLKITMWVRHKQKTQHIRYKFHFLKLSGCQVKNY